jgi:hypothetical protein
MSHLVAYITGHGFGHSTRTAAVIAALAARVPGLCVTIVSTAPEALFRLNLDLPFAYRRQALDVGVIQHDSIRLDARATLEAVAHQMAAQSALMAAEAAVLRRDRADLVLADIPPAAFPIARAAGLPAVGLSNFSWDWIYATYVHEFPEFAFLLPAIRDAYGQADLFLRLPFHGPCDAFPMIRDIPMVARRARRPRAEVRHPLGLDESRRVVLLSFGGFELAGVDWQAVEALTDFQFVATQPLSRPLRNVRMLDLDGCRYEDVIGQADAVITKPGYGIVSDCLANRVPLLYTSRGTFPEYAPLVDGLTRWGVARFITNDELLAGCWREPLIALLDLPPTWADISADGANEAAGILAGILAQRS